MKGIKPAIQAQRRAAQDKGMKAKVKAKAQVKAKGNKVKAKGKAAATRKLSKAAMRQYMKFDEWLSAKV